MNSEEATKSEDLIPGKCEVNGKTLTILYDLGAIHSFVSFDCINGLELPIFELPYDLLVSTPTNEPVKTNQVCMKILFQIDGWTFVAYLICLSLAGLDIILDIADFLTIVSC